ncbi:MAG: AMIN domain-containing protein [Candidatus Aminicenantes bacterium]|nr:AMIN domain-containing protein [Candidatus Aminicenantes bacterium]
MNSPIRWATAGVFAVFLFAAPLTAFVSPPAQVDPFYLKALSEGERLLAAEDYANAVLSLEIAAFGLQNDRPNLSKALGHLALAAYRAGQVEAAREAVRRMKALVGDDGLSKIEMNEEWKSDLLKVAALFEEKPFGSERPGESRVEGEERPQAGREGKDASRDLDRLRLEALEEKIKKEPENAGAWLELYDLQSRMDDARAAKKTLRKFADRVPEDPRGPFLLGKIAYADWALKDAVRHFEKVLALAGEKENENVLILSSLGHLVLALNALRRKDELREKCLLFVERAPEGWLASLDMEDRNKIVLEGILTPYFRPEKDEAETGASEEGPPAGEASRETSERAGPGNPAQAEAAALAYGIFDQHLQENNIASARRTLERLLRQHPEEIRAVHLLAVLDFRQKRFEKARERFQAVIKEARRRGDEESLLAEAAAHLILCARELRGHESARSLAQAYRSDLEGGALEGLGLEGADKQFIRDYLSGPPGEGGTERTLERVSVQDSADGLRVEIVCVPRTTFRTFTLERDRKIVVDLFAVSKILAERVVPVGKRGVQALRTGLFRENTARIVLDIQGDLPAYDIRETETGLLILVR